MYVCESLSALGQGIRIPSLWQRIFPGTLSSSDRMLCLHPVAAIPQNVSVVVKCQINAAAQKLMLNSLLGI